MEAEGNVIEGSGFDASHPCATNATWIRHLKSTGDNENLMLFAYICLIALICLLVLKIKKLRQELKSLKTGDSTSTSPTSASEEQKVGWLGLDWSNSYNSSTINFPKPSISKGPQAHGSMDSKETSSSLNEAQSSSPPSSSSPIQPEGSSKVTTQEAEAPTTNPAAGTTTGHAKVWPIFQVSRRKFRSVPLPNGLQSSMNQQNGPNEAQSSSSPSLSSPLQAEGPSEMDVEAIKRIRSIFGHSTTTWVDGGSDNISHSDDGGATESINVCQ